MDFALAQLALIFLPGLIWATIDAQYGAGSKPKQGELIIRVFLFGIVTYFVLFGVYATLGWEFNYLSSTSESESFNLLQLKDEIGLSIPLSFGLSIAWLWAVRYRFFAKILVKIGATERYGDQDFWGNLFNSDHPFTEFIHIRDVDNGYIIAGWVESYSDREDQREFLLREAIVYDKERTEMYASPYLYISRPKDNIWLEFPYKEGGK